MRRLAQLGFVLAACISGLAADANSRLKVGDPAPPIKVSKWLQGEPVSVFEKGKVYIVEFWASWCGPCKIYIPHLNKLHQTFQDKGLTVIGVAIREDEPADAIKFHRQMGDQMTYRVAIDDESEGKGFMDRKWMNAAETDSLPHSFIVNQDGVLAYIGHPIGIKEPMLEQILARKFDVKEAAARYERVRQNEMKIKTLEAEFETALEAKDYAKAEKTIIEREPLTEAEDRPSLELSRLQLKIRTKNLAEAEKIARALAADKSDVARFFDGLAWTIATEEGVNPALLDIGISAANRANEMTKGEDPSVFETLARLKFLKGDKAGAVTMQEKAVKAVPATETERTKRRYQMALEAYRAGKLPQ